MLDCRNIHWLPKISIFLLLIGLLYAFCFATQYGLPLQSPVLICLSLVGLLASLVNFQSIGARPSKLTWLVIISALYFIIRAIISPVVDFGREDLFLILAASLMYICMVDVLGTKKAMIQLAYVVLIGLCLHLGSAIPQFMGKDGYWPIAFFTDANRANPDGITGMYGYRGSFANYSAIAAMLALSLGIWGEFRKWFRCILCLLAMLSITGVFISQSRSAALSVLVGIVVMLCLFWVSLANQASKKRPKMRAWILILGSMGVVLVAVSIYYVFFLRAGGAGETGVDVFFNDGARLGYWPMALEQWQNHPIWGAGSRSFSYELHRYWNPNLRIREPNPEFVHNEYLQLAADYGLTGLLLVLCIVAVHMGNGFVCVTKLARDPRIVIAKGSNMMALKIAGVVGIVVMSVHVCFDFRTHLMANLLLLVCCLIWASSPSGTDDLNLKPKKLWFMHICSAVVLLLCGLLGLYMGITELRGGLPLMRLKVVTETGSWDPAGEGRKQMIVALEQSIDRAPSFRRHLKLGTLYHLESGITGLDSEKSDGLLRKSLHSYLEAEKLHPYDPVIQVNLGSVYSALDEHQNADMHFSKSIELSGVRGDSWFGIYWKWAEAKHRRALEEWGNNLPEDAKASFATAIDLLHRSKQQFKPWQAVYRKVMSNYLLFLTEIKEYQLADSLINEALGKSSSRIFKKMHLVMARYYSAKGKHYWYNREASKAHKMFMISQRYYRRQKKADKGKVSAAWEEGYKEVVDILRFFKQANIKSAP